MMHSALLAIFLFTFTMSVSITTDTVAIMADGKAVVTVTLPTGWTSVMSGE